MASMQKHPVLTDELDERAFLFVREVCPDGELIGGITGGKINLLCVLSRLEFHLFSVAGFLSTVLSSGSTCAL